MSVVRAHTYAVDAAHLEEFLDRRAAAIAAVRAAHPGLIETRLTRLENGTYTDVWRWESLAQMGEAAADLPNIPEAGLAMALVGDHSALNGELVDER